MLMKSFFLHIGNHKTGTTSIQNFLFDNRLKIIKEYKIFYPSAGIYFKDKNHLKLYHDITSKKKKFHFFLKNYQKIFMGKDILVSCAEFGNLLLVEI